MGDSLRGWLAVLLTVAVVGTMACSTTIHSAAGAAGATVGEAAGEAMVGEYSPRFRSWYVRYLTSLAFYSGGYSLAPATRNYRPGEYTRFAVRTTEGEQMAEITRAYLFEDDEGNQGWKVRFVDREAGDTTIVELLFSPERERLLRMRARFPDEETGQELPVEEGQYYRTPNRLTEESVEGATIGTETIQVPAGSFETRHVQYGLPGTRGSQDWWIVDDVPGGIVRYAHRVRGESESEPEGAKGLDSDDYVLELTDSGKGAKSELGLKP